MLAPALLPDYAVGSWRIQRRRLLGPHRFAGDASAILRACVEACWTGDYLAASGGHFRQFWIRDLGFTAPSLMRLGQGARVEASLAWALEAWSREGRVTTTIFRGRRAADVYTFGVDSLPFLLAGLAASGEAGERLVGRHGEWLGREVERYGATVLDPASGLVRADRRFSTHRDTVRTASNCYANAMLLLFDRVLRATAWFRSPVPDGAAERFVAAFWRSGHFSDRPGADVVTGDAGIFPFWIGVVPDELGVRAALHALEAAGLTDPLPLRYVARRDPAAEDPIQRLFVPDYQGTTIWTSLGAIYVALLGRADPASARGPLAAYRALVERDGTLREALSADLRPYRGRVGLFLADEAMLWSAILLEALEASGLQPEAAPSSEAGVARPERGV